MTWSFVAWEGGNVALEDEVRLHGALDGLDDCRVRLVNQVPDLLADGLLPRRQWVDVGVDPRILEVGHPDVCPFDDMGPMLAR